MAKVVYTQVTSGKVGQVTGVGKGHKPSKVDVSVWINFTCNGYDPSHNQKPVSFPFFPVITTGIASKAHWEHKNA